jgi:DNA-binding transcriptional MerR regulator
MTLAAISMAYYRFLLPYGLQKFNQRKKSDSSLVLWRREGYMKEFYTVGEVSKIFNVSTDTLRYYDKINLIKPWKTGDNGYRYYSKAQFEMISTIILLRSIGTPIQKLYQVLNDQDASGIEHELLRYIEEIDVKISELQSLKAKSSLLCKNIKDTCYDEDITVRQMPRLWLLSKEFGTKDELDIEEILKTNNATKGDWVSFANIISTIDQEKLKAGDYHSYKIYGFLSEHPCDTDSKYLEIIESRLCVCCNARVNRIDHTDIDRIYDNMMDFIKNNGYTINGDAIERHVLDLYQGKDKELTIFFKIYIPVAGE